MTNSEKNYQVAKTILNQLGGNKFMFMTGSKNPVSIENGLRIKLSKNKSKANFLYVRLNGLDTYDLEFISARGTSVKTKSEYSGIYNDQLIKVFEAETGLYTRL